MCIGIRKHKGAIVEAVLFSSMNVQYVEKNIVKNKEVPVYYTFDSSGIHTTIEYDADVIKHNPTFYTSMFGDKEAGSKDTVSKRGVLHL